MSNLKHRLSRKAIPVIKHSSLNASFSLLMLLASSALFIVLPVKAQSEKDEYPGDLRQAVQQIVDKNRSLSLSMHELPSSVDNRFEFEDTLELALTKKDVDAAVKLLQPHGLTIKANPRIGFSADVYPYQPDNANLAAAKAIGNSDIEALEAAMSDPDFAIDEIIYIPYNYGVTLLMVAAVNGEEEIIRTLLDAGANPRGTGEDASSPLSRAAFGSRLGAVRLLIEAGAKVNMLKAGSRAQETLLAHYVNMDKKELVELLLKHKANANFGDRFGWTPLMDAVHKQNPEMVQLLLPYSDPRISSQQEITVTDQETKDIDSEYPIVDAMDIAKRFQSQTGNQIMEAIQKRLDALEPAPAVPLPTQLDNAVKQIRQYRTDFDVLAAFETANDGIELLADEKIDKLSDSDLVDNAIYLLLYKHETALATGETLNDTDKSLAQQLNAAGSNAQKWHDMLDILAIAETGSAQAEIDAWENSYGIPDKGLWNFDLLSRWIDSNDDDSIRDRLYDTLDYFELR